MRSVMVALLPRPREGSRQSVPPVAPPADAAALSTSTAAGTETRSSDLSEESGPAFRTVTTIVASPGATTVVGSGVMVTERSATSVGSPAPTWTGNDVTPDASSHPVPQQDR